MTPPKQQLAEDRTDWAEDRTVLANERTFAGWMRTGMAAVAVAIGLKAVFGDFDPTWVAKGVATIFLLGALYIFWSARRQAVATRDRMSERDARAQPTRTMSVMTAILCAGTVATGVILWSL